MSKLFKFVLGAKVIAILILIPLIFLAIFAVVAAAGPIALVIEKIGIDAFKIALSLGGAKFIGWLIEQIMDVIGSTTSTAAISSIGQQQIPAEYLPLYHDAASKYGVEWNVLAAMHKVETDFGRHPTMISPAGALGHMQFMPATWAGWKWPHTELGKITTNVNIKDPNNIKKGGGYGVDADGDGKADPFVPADSIFAAAKFLADHKGKDGSMQKAIYAYNHDEDYVASVLQYSAAYVSEPVISPGGAGSLAWPVPSTHTVTSPYGYRTHPVTGELKLHKGIDIAAAGIQGKPAVAIANAKVLSAGARGGYGNAVVLDLGNGRTCLYAHLQKVLVSSGQTVQSGQPIGQIGSTGLSTGPHLHFEMKVKDRTIDPLPLLRR